MRWLGGAVVAALMCAPALAQESEPQAAPGSIGYGMIENASAQGIFELVHNGQVTLRHTRSGLVCHFPRDGAGGRLIVFAPQADPARPDREPTIPRGDDVACEMSEGGAQVRVFATRYPFGSTLEEQIDGVAAAIRARSAAAAPFPGDTVRNPDDGLPIRRSARFIVEHNGERLFTRASVARVGDWILKLRFSAPAPDDAAATHADRRADALFDGVLREIVSPPTN